MRFDNKGMAKKGRRGLAVFVLNHFGVFEVPKKETDFSVINGKFSLFCQTQAQQPHAAKENRLAPSAPCYPTETFSCLCFSIPAECQSSGVIQFLNITPLGCYAVIITYRITFLL